MRYILKNLTFDRGILYVINITFNNTIKLNMLFYLGNTITNSIKYKMFIVK